MSSVTQRQHRLISASLGGDCEISSSACKGWVDWLGEGCGWLPGDWNWFP